MIDWCRNVTKHTYQRNCIKPLSLAHFSSDFKIDIHYCFFIYLFIQYFLVKTIFIVSPNHTINSILLFVNNFSGSVPFRKIPIPVWVLVLCGTKRNRLIFDPYSFLFVFGITAVKLLVIFYLNLQLLLSS